MVLPGFYKTAPSGHLRKAGIEVGESDGELQVAGLVFRSHSLLQCLGSPLIQALPARLRRNQCLLCTSGGTLSSSFPEAGFSGVMPWDLQSSR